MVNWLPTIMNKIGYDSSSALPFAIMLNVGAAIGIVIAGRIADRGRGRLRIDGPHLPPWHDQKGRHRHTLSQVEGHPATMAGLDEAGFHLS